MLPKRQYKLIDNKDCEILGFRFKICIRDARYSNWSWLPDWLNPYDNFTYFDMYNTKEDALKRIEEDKADRLNPKEKEIIEYY